MPKWIFKRGYKIVAPREEDLPIARPAMNDIHWLAGVLEGEGSFHGSFVAVYQKDSWLPSKLKELFGGSIHVQKSRDNINIWHAGGVIGRGIQYTVYKLMSHKRKRQILIAIAKDLLKERNAIIREARNAGDLQSAT